MTVLVVVVVIGLVFTVGLLIGQEWNRRALNAGRQRLVALTRERDDLVRLLRRDDGRSS